MTDFDEFRQLNKFAPFNKLVREAIMETLDKFVQDHPELKRDIQHYYKLRESNFVELEDGVYKFRDVKR